MSISNLVLEGEPDFSAGFFRISKAGWYVVVGAIVESSAVAAGKPFHDFEGSNAVAVAADGCKRWPQTHEGNSSVLPLKCRKFDNIPVYHLVRVHSAQNWSVRNRPWGHSPCGALTRSRSVMDAMGATGEAGRQHNRSNGSIDCNSSLRKLAYPTA